MPGRQKSPGWTIEAPGGAAESVPHLAAARRLLMQLGGLRGLAPLTRVAPGLYSWCSPVRLDAPPLLGPWLVYDARGRRALDGRANPPLPFDAPAPDAPPARVPDAL